MKKKCTLLLCALLALLLCACGGTGDDSEVPPPEEESGPFTLAVRVSEAQPTLAPASATARGSETILYHLFENLLRWEDDGSGWAVLANGQAEEYTVETDYAGNASYTFKLREDAVWSDGKAVTAEDFVNAWRRLADPANDLPYRGLMSAIAGYEEVQETGDASLLEVSAPDSRTLAVTLTGSPAWFLEEVCAGAHTMPVREDLAGQSNGAVTNGAYTATAFTRQQVTLERSESYCNTELQGPEIIQFDLMTDSQGDYDALLAGDTALVMDLPAGPLQELADSGLWTPEPVTETYGILMNTQTAPFDNANVRLAFHLAVDRQTVVTALGDLSARPAAGVVPYGVSDYSERPAVEEEPVSEEPVLPDPNAAPVEEPEEPAPTCWDFRSHSLAVVTVEHTHDYETDRSYAQTLMADAGYPRGAGFPEVEYLYVNGSGADAELARLLQEMWKDVLDVTVKLRGVSQDEYDAAIAPTLPEEDGEGNPEEAVSAQEEEAEPVPAFQMAAQILAPAYNDAGALLEYWHSEMGENVTGYASAAFDILLDSARAAVSPDARDAYLHDAEAILLNDSPVIPVFCRGGSFRLAEGLTGLYRAPNEVFFLYAVHRDGVQG